MTFMIFSSGDVVPVQPTAGTVVRSCPERLRFCAGQCVAGDGNAKLASKGEPRRCKAFR
jgi:hypothetical protein